MALKQYDVILDCYSDEPSGYGVPPFLGVHQRYISGALDLLGRTHFYLTIDDLRCAMGKGCATHHNHTDITTLNLTKNVNDALTLLTDARTIYIVMGCFIDYQYVSAAPPRARELYELLKGLSAKKVLFYVLGAMRELPVRFRDSDLFGEMNTIVTGLAYNFILNNEINSFAPNYNQLSTITQRCAPILPQIESPRIIELESMMGCNWSKCSFCIEHHRGYPLAFREVNDIVSEAAALYEGGARYFRIGRNPNFYYYMKQDVSKMEALLDGIRSRCPDLRTLHIDNVNPESVVTPEGREITKLIVQYCTSGNIAPFGIESFDPLVREKNTLNANVDQIMEAISIMNEYGREKGENGAPRFLNGINLIYGLPGQTPDTLRYNLEHLHRIFEGGYETQRLFFRRLASPFGISLKDAEISRGNEQYEDWKNQIYDSYSIPMLDRVFPSGTVLSNARVEVWENGNSVLRQLGTCPPRIVIENELVPIGSECDVEVLGVLKHRTLRGNLLTKS